VQDLRREAELALDDRIELWLDGLDAAVDPYLPAVLADTLADRRDDPAPTDAHRATVALDGGDVTIALRRAG
jgi:hypothetical protein